MADLFPDDWDPNMPDEDDALWRYIDFTQFVSILENEALWFPAASGFLDTWEGGLTSAQVERLAENIPFIDDKWGFVANVMDSLRETTYVSCWHQRDTETASMWELYKDKGKEVAIKTTVGEFVSAVVTTDDMHIGCVEYEEYDDDERNLFPISRESPFFYKRESFKPESEFRAIKCEYHPPDLTEVNGDYRSKVAEEAPPGKPITIDRQELVKEVVVSPTAGNWMPRLVKDVLKTYELEDVRVSPSKLSKDPYERNS